MSVFIELNALKRNGKDFAKKILVDVNDIVVPIIENESNNSIVEVDTDVSYSETYTENREKYVVSEDLDAINLLSNEVFKGTIVSQNDRDSLWPAAVFIKKDVIGTVTAFGALGESQFDYKRMAQASTDRFVVGEDLATINS